MAATQEITVVIADDHTLFRKGLASVLWNYDEINVVGEAAQGRMALNMIQEKQPDILLLDWDMPVMNGQEVLKSLKRISGKVKCIVISFHQEDTIITKAIKMGAGGFLTKDAEPEEIIKAIHSMQENGFYFNETTNKAIHQKLVRQKFIRPSMSDGNVTFSEKEIHVLHLLSLEFTSDEIGKKLFMSERTVEGIRQRMIQKVGARNIVGLLTYVFRRGIVEI